MADHNTKRPPSELIGPMISKIPKIEAPISYYTPEESSSTQNHSAATASTTLSGLSFAGADPDNAISIDSDEDEDDEDDEDNINKEELRVPKVINFNDSNDDDDDDDNTKVYPQFLSTDSESYPSSSESFENGNGNGDNVKPEQHHESTNGNGNGNGKDDIQQSEDSEHITPSERRDSRRRCKIRKVNGKWQLPEISREESQEARKYLKREGMMSFLEKYLPDTPKGSDILYTIIILGFFSINLNDDLDDETNFLKLISTLKKAMNKVLEMRTRLDNVHTLHDAVKQIERAKNIIILTGAGISTSLGIPDFRSSKGIYSQVRHLGLTDPQEVFDMETFRDDPSIFYSVAHMVLPPLGSYTPLHAFIKKIDDEGKLLRNYTQNIDNLEANAGISRDKFIQCHGSFATATCQTCRWQIEGSKIFKYIKDLELPVCPKCYNERKKRFEKNEDYYPKSYGVMKPDITFFGEDLPKTFYDSIKVDIEKCDLLICIGTSLKVAPVSEIVNMISSEVPQILINKDLVEHCEFDVSILGFCDEVATYLSKKLGWTLNHPDFEKIWNSDLRVTAFDEETGIYEINSFATIDEEIRAAKVMES